MKTTKEDQGTRNEQASLRSSSTGDRPQQPESPEIDRIVRELQELPSYSAQIRYLAAEGFRKSSIAHILGELRGKPMSSQHVNNVLSRPLKGTGQGNRAGRPPTAEDPRTRAVIRALPKPVVTLIKKDELEARRSLKQQGEQDGGEKEDGEE